MINQRWWFITCLKQYWYHDWSTLMVHHVFNNIDIMIDQGWCLIMSLSNNIDIMIYQGWWFIDVYNIDIMIDQGWWFIMSWTNWFHVWSRLKNYKIISLAKNVRILHAPDIHLRAIVLTNQKFGRCICGWSTLGWTMVFSVRIRGEDRVT